VQRHDPLRVAAFGHPRISAGWRLPEAYRSLPRPSSAPGAKASPVRPCLRRARSLAGAPPAGSCALLQAMHLLKAWTTPPWAVAPGSSVPVATPHCSVSSRYSDRPTPGPCHCLGAMTECCGSTAPAQGTQKPAAHPAGRRTASSGDRLSRSTSVLLLHAPAFPLARRPTSGAPTYSTGSAAPRPSSGQEWSRGESNPRPPPCKGGALPTKLRPRGRLARSTQRS
jgi:hypothetical protein